ncbi:DUF4157 domain-containing protein [Arenimonas oryziterrae]|uniref:eCIS core domain-containing protein n=1 Tax=Arenimonas oryziterrae DSM 21050 = YC6267 TaxID=1121015 RepID=A0A091AUC7_9GAMM|nr:DUF4157 domain-containing protein [Arenimonas oryziterrae]KFN42966.1 hypothetical protein N789_12645 [Arenimonas oryziterrae DSM 21050 = YC6267]
MNTPARKQKRPPPPAAKRVEPAPAPQESEPDSERSACACGGGCPRCSAPTTPLASASTDAATVALPDSVRETLASPGHALDAATQTTLRRQFSQVAMPAPVTRSTPPLASGQDIAVSDPDDASEQQASQFAAAIAGAGSPPPDDPGGEGPDFSEVRVHTDATAARSAQALSANAYSFGRHIVMGAGRYAPGTPAGHRLLAHELTHSLQPSATPIIQRDGNGQETQGSVSMTVSLDGLHFEFPGFTLQQGLSRPQIMAMILRRLVGEQYKPGLENDVIAALDQTSTTSSGHLSKDSQVKAGETPHVVNVDLGATVQILLILNRMKLANTLTEPQKELLRNAGYTNAAWQQIKGDLPAWYTEWIFRREVAQQGTLLAAFRAAREAGNDAAESDASVALEEAILPGSFIVDTVRQDVALASEINKPSKDILVTRDREGCSVAYALMFNVSLSPGTVLTEAPETVSQTKVADFLRFMRTQPKLMAEAGNEGDAGHEARVQLMGRFGRFYVRARSSGGKDEKILAKPALANTPPWGAILSSTPQVMPPLYDAALETDHAFTMSLQWEHWTDAWASYSYQFEFIRVPDSSLTNAPDLTMAAGEKPSFGKVLDTRLARTRRYNAADLERVRGLLGGIDFGVSARDLVEANNALRTVGTVIHSVLEKITEPRYVTRYVFPNSGMYIVRCRALPMLDGDEEIVRLPSVAFLPIVARNPDEMAIGQVNDATSIQFNARLRIAEIQAMFSSPIPPENSEALRQEIKDLQAMLLTPEDALVQRKADLDSQIAKIETRIRVRSEIIAAQAEPDSESKTFKLRSLQQELAQAGGDGGDSVNSVDDERLAAKLRDASDDAAATLDTHQKRTKGERGMRFAPNVSFVSDLGHSMQLSIEMYDRGEGDGVYQVFMSDLTTKDGGEALGEGDLNASSPRRDAIKKGLKKLLESSSDYGRGRVAVNIDGSTEVVRIDAGGGRIFMESLESVSMVASLAAIVAAPFTAGASLYLLLPIGAIGAIPSAYRLYERYDENRLRLDFAAAMDVVNIVGGVLGLAQAATPLRCVRLGKVLMVMGIGADGAGILMMGAGLAMQLDALSGVPEHERAARLMEILGGAMLQIGIQAGGAVMHARYQSKRTGASATDPKLQTAMDEPGFHAVPKEDLPPTATKPPPPAAGDRSMAGAGAPPGDGNLPAPKPATKPTVPTTTDTTPAAPKASPEHLFDKLGTGVDRSLPPAQTAEAAKTAKTTTKAGEFQRGLTTADAAYAAYNKALASAGGREVAIYHNPETGEFCVMVGSETGVHAPAGLGWDALVHFHPNEGNVLTFRMPAPQDFRGLMMRFVSEGVMVREFIEFDIPGVGRGRTEYGIDPGNPEPFYVRIHQPDGSPPQTVRFAHDGHYRAYWGERTIAVPKDSPVYDAMIRDIEAYLRSIGADQRGDFGPPAAKPAETGTATPANKPADGSDTATPAAKPADNAGGATPKPKPADTGGGTVGGTGKTVSGATTPASHAMQTGTGDLTDVGVDFLRNHKQIGKKIAKLELTDAQIRERYKNESSWLEAVVTGEARMDWLGRENKTDFLMSDPTQDFNKVASKLSKAAMKGKTGHTIHDAILSWSAKDFIEEMLAQKDPGLTAAYNACESNVDPGFKKRWNEFKYSSKQGDMSGFFLGTVGKKRPDMVEVMLSLDTIHIVDASFAFSDPIHNFKSAFYKTVMERLITVGTVTSTDYRAPLLQTPM